MSYTNVYSVGRRHFFLKLREEKIEYDDPDNFAKTLSTFGAKLDASLIEQFSDEFSCDISIKGKKVTKVPLLDVSDYYLTRHPTEPPPAKKGRSKKKKKKNEKKGEENEKK